MNEKAIERLKELYKAIELGNEESMREYLNKKHGRSYKQIYPAMLGHVSSEIWLALQDMGVVMK